jgi:hypothetical protein
VNQTANPQIGNLESVIAPLFIDSGKRTCKFCQKSEASEGEYCSICAEFQAEATGSMFVVVWLALAVPISFGAMVYWFLR